MADAQKNNSLEQAIEMLTADHDKVRLLFREYKKLMDLDADADARGAIAAQICHELTLHASIEEQYFYPAARKAIAEDAEEFMDHADVEHQSLKRLIADIEAGHPDDEHYDAMVHVLQEYVAHHVSEEENEMFEELRHAQPNMQTVLRQMIDAKQSAVQQPKSPAAQSKKERSPARRSKSAARKQVRTSGSKKRTDKTDA